MQIVTDINHINHTEWQQLLANSHTATWFQTPKAYDFFASMPTIMSPFICAVTNDSQLKGIMLGYITKERNPIKQFFTRRAIINGGPLLAEDISNEELTTLLKQVQNLIKNKAIYIETRNFHDFSKWRTIFESTGFSYQPHFDIHIDCASQTNIMENLHESKQRAIRKLINDGYTIVEAQSQTEVESWYKLLKNLYKTKVHRPLFSIEFFIKGWETGICKLILIKDKIGTIIGGLFAPQLKNQALYEWYIVGNALSTWAGIEYAHNNNLPIFDLMGAGTPNKPYGVRDFKMQFGGTLKELGRYINTYHHLLFNFGKLILKFYK